MMAGDSTLGELLRHIREENKWSLEYMAGKLSNDAEFIYAVERGVCLPTVREVLRWTAPLDVDPKVLLVLLFEAQLRGTPLEGSIVSIEEDA